MNTINRLLFLTALGAAACSAPVVGGDAAVGDASAAMDAAMDAAPQCTGTQTSCGGRCVDTRSDTGNCGGCGVACAAGQVCSMGRCAIACPPSQRECGGACVTTNTDREHCGACGNRCGTGLVCSAGACVLECGAGLTTCGGGEDGGAGDGGEAARFCTDTRTDPRNCGACGAACGAGSVCRNGTCEVSCPPGQTNCGGQCRELGTDPRNCGACGTACGASEVCTMGACALSCPPSQQNCGGTCRDTQSDSRNCGACGAACASGQVCTMGACVTSCSAGLAECGGTCRDLQTDNANCGTCGTACPAGQACTMGSCSVRCPMGLENCGGVCVDRQTDGRNCGACGTVCGAGQVCSMGACVVSCPAGQTNCGGTCRDLQTDSLGCGACGTACAAGQQCIMGACRVVCAMGQSNCAGACVNLQSDNGNCGACGRTCPAGQVCSAGACAPTCGAGLTVCSGACTNTTFDPANCGACGAVCALPNAVPVCATGACRVLSCNAGFANCDGNDANGCEVNLNSNLSHCGACGTVCTTPANAAPACAMGACGLGACNANFGNCDGNAANGCEVNTQTNVNHCGGCNTPCAVVANGTPACNAGTCTLASCNTGFANCDGNPTNGCETNTQSSNSHCGACGRACRAGETCANGACTTPNCQTVAGVRWCFNPATCGQACNDVCASLGLPFTISDAAWFAAQDTVAECQAISNAFGIATPVNFASYTFACMEDSTGMRAVPATLVGPLFCSSNAMCPAAHRTNMDQLGQSCASTNGRLSICPCQ